MKNRTNRTIRAIIIIVAIVSLFALPKLDLWSSGSDTTDPATQRSKKRPGLLVEAMVIRPSTLDNKVVTTGTVWANESLELKSEVAGKITHIYFEEGKKVKKGDLLIQVNDAEIKALLTKQKHNKKWIKSIETRQKKLLEKEAISQEEYDDVLNKLNTTDADIEVLETQLEKTKLRAPFDGIIGLRYVSPGAFISTNTLIAELYDMTKAKIEFTVPSQYSTKVHVDQTIYFYTENNMASEGNNMMSGKIYAIEPQIDRNTRTLKMRALTENKQRLLFPGQFLKVELILASIENTIMIPAEAMVPDLAGYKVYVSRGGKAEEIKVEVGIRNETDIQITSGLFSGDTLLTTGVMQLRSGLGIQIKSPS